MTAPVTTRPQNGVVPLRLDEPEARLEMVGLEYVQQLVGDRTLLATRRWVERLRTRGILRPVPLAGSRKLRFRKADILALVSGSMSDPGSTIGTGASVAPETAKTQHSC